MHLLPLCNSQNVLLLPFTFTKTTPFPHLEQGQWAKLTQWLVGSFENCFGSETKLLAPYRYCLGLVPEYQQNILNSVGYTKPTIFTQKR